MLRFYFITDDGAAQISPLQQTAIALQAGCRTRKIPV